QAPRTSTPRTSAAASGARRTVPGASTPWVAAIRSTSSDPASVGEGYQVSRTRPSGASVARPAAHAPEREGVVSLTGGNRTGRGRGRGRGGGGRPRRRPGPAV